MCEPHHSIIQYDDSDDDLGGSAQSVVKEGIKAKLGRWAKKVSGYFHYSKMGKGHSEGIEVAQLGITRMQVWQMMDNNITSYEAAWWDRSFSIDGRFHGPRYDLDLATDAAREYADAVSIGSLSALRRFLETSLTSSSSTRVGAYYDVFVDHFLNKRGKTQFLAKVPTIIGKTSNLRYLGDQSSDTLTKLMKLALGFTRKRSLLVPEWADDKLLWLRTKR